MVKDPQAIDPDVLYNLEMSMRSNEMEGLVYTEEEKELFRSACTSEEHLDAVIKDYLKKLWAVILSLNNERVVYNRS